MNKYNLIFQKNKLLGYSLKSEEITISLKSEEKEVGALIDFEKLYPDIILDSFQIMNSTDAIFLEFKDNMKLIEYSIEDLEKFKIV